MDITTFTSAIPVVIILGGLYKYGMFINRVQANKELKAQEEKEAKRKRRSTTTLDVKREEVEVDPTWEDFLPG